MLVGIVSSIVASALVFLLTRGWERTRHARRYRHLLALAAGRRVQIVIPDFRVPEFEIDGAAAPAAIPPNVRVMPMAEGAAIARLVLVLRSLGKEVRLATQQSYDEEVDLTISIGGPSVNACSRALLEKRFPHFELRYPEHVARYGTTTFAPARAADGSLREDYGFIAVTRTLQARPCLILCGVWAPGTHIATTALLEHVKQGSDVWRACVEGSDFFAVAHAELDGLTQTDVKLTSCVTTAARRG